MSTSVFVHGKNFTGELAQALKIDRPIRRLVIDSDCRAIASVTVEFVPTDEDGLKLAAILGRYGLVVMDPPEGDGS